MKSPECTICHTSLEHTPQGWKCPRSGFYFNVERGVAGRPMWLEPPEGEVAQPEPKARQPVTEETFEEWREKHGVTAEMYDGADERTKLDLKTAFYQRHQENPDVALFPPQ